MVLLVYEITRLVNARRLVDLVVNAIGYVHPNGSFWLHLRTHRLILVKFMNLALRIIILPSDRIVRGVWDM